MGSSQKRLAIYLPTLVSGGTERAMLNLAVGFVQRGFSVDFVLAQCEGSFMAHIPEAVRLIELNSMHVRAGRSVISLPALVRYIRKERPSALFTALHANVIAVWARWIAGVPFSLVISEQNTLSIHNKMLPTGYQQIMLGLIKRSYPMADVIAAVSEGVADDLALTIGIPRDRIRVIYNPIITPDLAAKVKEDINHPWFNPGEPPVVLAVGRLDPQKDYPLLIKSFARVRQFVPARLLILGEGPERDSLISLVRQLDLDGDVQFPGFVPNPYPYMAKASVFVLSSRWEGLPTVLVEALYCGASIVATDCPSGSREILRDGKYGRLVPVGDIECMAEAIISVLKGNGILPPGESWEQYDLDTIVSQYLVAAGCE